VISPSTAPHRCSLRFALSRPLFVHSAVARATKARSHGGQSVSHDYNDMTLLTPTRRHSSAAYGRSALARSSILHRSPPKQHNTNIKVIARFRPPTEYEANHGHQVAEFYSDGQAVSINARDFSNTFTFDKVFPPEASQLDVYEFLIKSTIDDLFKGYNGTVLAYGQSGSGKSYTMTGGTALDGIVPRLISDIFNTISHSLLDIEYIVGVSYMEIYMEQVRDLLDDSNTKQPHPLLPLQQPQYTIHEDKDGNVYVRGVKHAFVSSSTELMAVLQRGNRVRAMAATSVNEQSSRSHAIFQIKLSQRCTDDDTVKTSNLFLVDLAGSEKVIKTGAIGHTLEEAKKINSSLSALGNVIYTLAEGKLSHIPYRDSRLTRILQESLGGNSRTSLIITCLVSSLNEQETLSTLRFGSSAKKIKNHAHVNTESSPAAMKLRIEALERTNEANKLYIEELETKLRQVGTAQVDSPAPTLVTPTRIPRYVPESATSTDQEVRRRDKKIEELEATLLELKMEKLKSSHEEELKLFKLEKLALKFAARLAELELANSALTDDIAHSTSMIEARNERISKLEDTLKEQQVQMLIESLNIDTKLEMFREKLRTQQQQHGESHTGDTPTRSSSKRNSNTFAGRPLFAPGDVPASPGSSPKLGLNLRIVKPLRGGEAGPTLP
jgi:kinesin family protein 5